MQSKTKREQGLSETMAFLASPAFAKLYQIMKREAEQSGDRIFTGLADEQATEFTVLCESRFGCEPPKGYAAFLRAMNGYEFNSQVVYGYIHPDAGASHFFHDNAYYADRMSSRRKHLLIGREDEGYYAYNLRTCVYVCLDSTLFDEVEVYSSFADLLITMMFSAFGSDELCELFPERSELYTETDEPLLSWDEPRMIAWALLQDYEKPIDVLSLSDSRLMEMLEDEGVLEMLPPVDPTNQEDVLYILKCAIARRISGEDNFDPFQNETE